MALGRLWCLAEEQVPLGKSHLGNSSCYNLWDFQALHYKAGLTASLAVRLIG